MTAMEHETVDTSKLWNAPSVFKQGWESGLFNFGKAIDSKTDYFNCGLVRRPDGLWLTPRRSRWWPKDQMGFNDIMAFSINEENMRLYVGHAVQMGRQWDIEHFEDPRAYYVDGRTYISACNFVRNKRGCTYPHQVICEVDKDWKLIKRYDPVYGHNGNDTAKNTLHEKNWTWFWTEGTNPFADGLFPHMVYKASPHTVIPFARDFLTFGMCDNIISGHKFVTDWDSSIWQYGEIRGGTPPVLVDGEYWTFFHSSTKFRTHKRQYHCGAYAFESKPPFRITKITTEPLLSGSTQDRWDIEKPPAVFVCGSEHKDGAWLITGGVNDILCGWWKIPHDELKDRMIEI